MNTRQETTEIISETMTTTTITKVAYRFPPLLRALARVLFGVLLVAGIYVVAIVLGLLLQGLTLWVCGR